MLSKFAICIAIAGAIAASDYALAKHDVDHSFPWTQTQSARGPKAQQNDSEHWGKHHHHGIFLEGSDYEHAPSKRYD